MNIHSGEYQYSAGGAKFENFDIASAKPTRIQLGGSPGISSLSFGFQRKRNKNTAHALLLLYETMLV